ncbi:cell envelope integrity protein TolA [Ferrigenium sp. UT5]|uniref:cell envelope integrity protein TolA n=1 Tax=Ferrigenium sp. UT5 TaxID=3242105 RepID=UPI003551DE25
MSGALHYREPNRLAAGMLAMAVHGGFLLLLMFGVHWQNRAPDSFSVELWQSLPLDEAVSMNEPAPVAVPKQEEVATPKQEEVPASPPPPTPQAEIELRDRKVVKKTPPQPSARELHRRREAEAQRRLEEQAEQRRKAEQARVRDEVRAATAAEVGRYQDMIRGKIRHNIVMPPDVSPNAEVVFKVTLLPGGSVLDAVLLKSSGNPAYDEATERAIYKAQPLPLPTDPLLKKEFRELRLTIRPEEK